MIPSPRVIRSAKEEAPFSLSLSLDFLILSSSVVISFCPSLDYLIWSSFVEIPSRGVPFRSVSDPIRGRGPKSGREVEEEEEGWACEQRIPRRWMHGLGRHRVRVVDRRDGRGDLPTPPHILQSPWRRRRPSPRGRPCHQRTRAARVPRLYQLHVPSDPSG